MRLGKVEDEGGGFGTVVGDGSEGGEFRDSVIGVGLGYGLGFGLGSVWSVDKLVGPVSGVGSMGEAVFWLWA